MSKPCETCRFQHIHHVDTPLGELLIEECDHLIGRYYHYFDNQSQCTEYTPKKEQQP